MSRVQTVSKTRARGRNRPNRQGPAETGRFLTGKNLKIALCFLVAAGTIAIYSPVIGHSFIVLDDHDYVTANSHIHAGLRWSTIQWAFASTAAANWHPLTWLSHALDYQLFGLNPAGHHFDSVLIHAVNVVLLFLLLSWMTGRIGPSLLVAALFALHPINVESVAWVAERKNLLCTLFFILAIGAYGWYVRKPGWRRYLVLALLFAAGLMAKPMVITLPFVLLLLDYWPLGRMRGSAASADGAPQMAFWRLVLEKVPLLVLSGASALITLYAQRAGYAVRSLNQFPLSIRIANADVAYGLYLWKMVWPARLALYPHAAILPPSWQWMVSGLVLTGITVLVVIYRGKGYLAVGWFWFLGTLVPVIGLVQVGEASMADRYAYIPLLGVFVMMAWGLDDWAEARRVSAVWRVIPALLALAALSFVTWGQIGYWDSDYDLWAHALAINERNPFAHDAMGSALLDPELGSKNGPQELNAEQRMDEAREHFEQALELRRQLAQQNPATYLPDMATTLNNLGNLDRMENRPRDAHQHYLAALEIHRQLERQNLERYRPDLATALNNLGMLEQSMGQEEDAQQHFQDALAIYRPLAEHDPDTFLPKVSEVLNFLALTEREEKRLDAAREHYEEALMIRRKLAQQDADAYLPYLATTLNDLGVLDGMQNRSSDAREHYEEGLRYYRQLAERDPEIYLRFEAATVNNLAFVEESEGRIDESRTHYKEALEAFQKLSHGDPDTYVNDVTRVERSLEGLEKKSASR
jgi:tetratricopeptide (TPR) repeat protein